MSRKTKKLMWSAPLVAVFAVVGALAAFIALAPSEALAQDDALGPPRSVMAAADGQAVIEVSWMAPASGEATAYRVDISDDGKTWTAEVSADVQTAISTLGDGSSIFTDVGLDAGTTKHYRVFAIFGTKGEGEPSATVTATTDPVMAPGKPTALEAAATPPTADTITLTWVAPTDDGDGDGIGTGAELAITGYKIERSENSDSGWMTLKEDTGLSTTPNITADCASGSPCTYTDTGLMAGDTWHYRVSAINKAEAGMASDSVSATTIAAAVPGAPTGLTAQGSNTQVTLYWASPGDPAGDPITGYQIERSVNGTTWEIIHTTTTPFTSYQTGAGAFSSGTEAWQYRVKAITADNPATAATSADRASTAVTIAPPDPTTHGMVQSLRARPKSPLSIRVSWRAGTGFEAGTTYRIDYSKDGKVWMEISSPTIMAETATSRSYYDNTGLEDGEKRYYRVIATTSNVLHVISDEVSATAGPPSRPGKPTTPAVTNEVAIDTVTAPRADRLALSWVAPTDIDTTDDVDASVLTGYRVERSRDDNSWMTIKEITGTDTLTYTDMKLMAESKWYYRVSAINMGVIGMPSDSVSATTADAALPGIPSGLVTVARGMSQVDLYWLRTGADPAGAPITGYKVEVTEDGGTTWTTVRADTGSSDTMYSHTGLTGDATRTYRVSAINSAGTSAPSVTDTAMPGEDTQPAMLGPATGVNASPGTTAGTAEVTWTPGPAATMHWIYAIRADEGEGGYTFEQASSNSSHTLTGLDSGVEYIVGISAGKGPLPGEWSAWTFARVTPN